MNPYSVLEISVSTSEEDAKKSFRRLCKKYHPDNPTSGDSIKFKEVMDAWEMLKSGKITISNSQTEWWGHKTLFSIFKRC